MPHRPFTEVFHESVADVDLQPAGSDFVSGLRELQSRRTQSGAGLREFLDQNLHQFEPLVAREIKSLANQIMEVGKHDG